MIPRPQGLPLIRVDVRVVAAPHRDLEAEGFRSDLYYRMAGGSLAMPPLHERSPFLYRCRNGGGTKVPPPFVPCP